MLDTNVPIFLTVDDRTVATGFPQIQAAIDEALAVLEAGGSPSFLEATLSLVEGTPVTHATPGDLFFYAPGQTSFDVPGLGIDETNVSNLDTDAMLSAATAIAGTTEIALQNRGSIRADLKKGATGVLSFADLFATVSLGIDPTDASPGYPLVRFYVPTTALRGALELTLQYALGLDPDYELLPSGLKIEYDPTREPFVMQNPAGPG